MFMRISPYDDWHRLAWAGALVLIVLIVRGGFAGALRDQPRRFERGKLSGRRHRSNQPECVVRHQSHAAGHQSAHPGQPCDGADRPFGLRQEHLCALHQPHARDQPHCARHRHGAHRRSGHLRRRQAGGDSPPRGHGLSAAQSLSHHVHLRQRGRGAEAERLLATGARWTRSSKSR